jgi:hypothetical protein
VVVLALGALTLRLRPKPLLTWPSVASAFISYAQEKQERKARQRDRLLASRIIPIA